jgi:DNA-binding HxlR family transcriptional regulator
MPDKKARGSISLTLKKLLLTVNAKKMKYFSKKYEYSPNCPIRNVLDRFGDKWSILIISILGEIGKMRFSELHKTIGDVSQKMLTTTLRTLEMDGLVSRKVFPEIPPRVEYELTDMGKSLVPHIAGLSAWADEHMPAIRKSRKRFEKNTATVSKTNSFV